MILFPAIDLQEGRCVRLVQGRFDEATTYGDDPAAMARRWAGEGAEWLHVVDLDGARAGEPRQLEIAAAIVRAVSIPVEIGGGYRRIEHVERALGAGLARVVLGSVAVNDPDLARSAFERFGERVLLGLDARGGRVAVHGWRDVSEFDLVELARTFEAAGARRIAFTDIGRDGMLTGVNLEETQRLSDSVSIPVIASGGVAGLDDLRTLAAMPRRGVEGVIIGKALYGGRFTLPEAIEAARATDPPA